MIGVYFIERIVNRLRRRGMDLRTLQSMKVSGTRWQKSIGHQRYYGIRGYSEEFFVAPGVRDCPVLIYLFGDWGACLSRVSEEDDYA